MAAGKDNCFVYNHKLETSLAIISPTSSESQFGNKKFIFSTELKINYDRCWI